MEIVLHPEVAKHIATLTKGKHSNPLKVKRINKTLQMLAEDHTLPRLASHRYEKLDAVWGEAIWESYVEQGTPSAWRIWWYFGPVAGRITVVAVGPHP